MAGDAPWPDALDPADATALRGLATERRYPAGVIIVHHGDEAGSVLVLLEGRGKEGVPGPGGKEGLLRVGTPRGPIRRGPAAARGGASGAPGGGGERPA